MQVSFSPDNLTKYSILQIFKQTVWDYFSMCFIFSLSSVRYPLLTVAYLKFLYYLWISVSWEYLSGGGERISSLTFEVQFSHSRLQWVTHSRWTTWLMSSSLERFLLPELSWEHYAPGPPQCITEVLLNFCQGKRVAPPKWQWLRNSCRRKDRGFCSIMPNEFWAKDLKFSFVRTRSLMLHVIPGLY